MKKIVVNSKNAPKAIGPYSQAIKIGNLVFTSGQIPIDPIKNEFIDDTCERQTEIVLNNLKAVLVEAGASLKSVIKTTVFLKNMQDFSAMNSIYERYFPENSPARSTIEVAGLPKGAKVEIEAIAEIEE